MDEYLYSDFPALCNRDRKQLLSFFNLFGQNGMRPAFIALQRDLRSDTGEQFARLLHPFPGNVRIGVAGAQQDRCTS